MKNSHSWECLQVKSPTKDRRKYYSQKYTHVQQIMLK